MIFNNVFLDNGIVAGQRTVSSTSFNKLNYFFDNGIVAGQRTAPSTSFNRLNSWAALLGGQTLTKIHQGQRKPGDCIFVAVVIVLSIK